MWRDLGEGGRGGDGMGREGEGRKREHVWVVIFSLIIALQVISLFVLSS